MGLGFFSWDWKSLKKATSGLRYGDLSSAEGANKLYFGTVSTIVIDLSMFLSSISIPADVFYKLIVGNYT